MDARTRRAIEALLDKWNYLIERAVPFDLPVDKVKLARVYAPEIAELRACLEVSRCGEPCSNS